MDEKSKCRCGTGSYCRQHRAYKLPPKALEREARRVALLGMSGKGRQTVKNTTEAG
jgi:hypothetical protein